MLALGLLALTAVLMWVVQSALLWHAGLPLQLRIDSSVLPRHLQNVDRGLVNVCLLAVVILYPVLRGESPSAYYLSFVPLDGHAIEYLHGFTMAIIYLGSLYACWAFTGNVHFRIRQSPGRLAGRLGAVLGSTLIGAGLEELLFRAMLLAGLLESLRPGIAVALGAAIFAAAHHVRRVKRSWTIAGHLALGTTLCVAFLGTRTLWLPMGLHAGGIFIIMGVRPFARYTGPGWLVGASIFPYAGAIGVAGLTLLSMNIWHFYGGGP